MSQDSEQLRSSKATLPSGASVRGEVTETVALANPLDPLTLTIGEVKNVGSLSYTNQLRDFAAYAQQSGYTFELWVRPTTQLSGPLQQAVGQGQITLRFLP